jgi:hypothetical protein
VSAQSQDDSDPDDPVEILKVLPEQYREQFRGQYGTAALAAAGACFDPTYETR